MPIITSDRQLTAIEIFMAARAIANMAYEYASPSVGAESWLDDRRDEEVNPYYSQTEQGIFLEIYYGRPGKIWTPWGQWTCWGSSSGDWTKALPQMLERLGATVVQDRQIIKGYGEVGPVYAIHRVDELELPEPKVRTSKPLPYNESKRLWRDMVEKYHGLNGTVPPMELGKKFELDNQILVARGKVEPTATENDIRTLEDLGKFAGRPIKFSRDSGVRWHYAILGNESRPVGFSNGKTGFPIYDEVMPNTQVHMRTSIMQDEFKSGIIVRPATLEEVAKIKFSYDKKC
jgi:hypothetical protein